MNAENDKTKRLTTVDTHNAITSWFSRHYQESPDELRQNRTWQTIKKYMLLMGHYKAKKRGEPNPNINLAQKGVKMSNKALPDTSYEEFNE